MVQYGVKTETDENVRAISSVCLNWGILENWAQKYIENIILALWLKFGGNQNLNWMFGETVNFED